MPPSGQEKEVVKLDRDFSLAYAEPLFPLRPRPGFLHSGPVKLPCVAWALPLPLIFNTMQ
jgi:hypothetical protein